MAVTGLQRLPDGSLVPSGAPPTLMPRENDIVARQQAEAAARVNPTDTFTTETVSVAFGKEQRDLVVRFAPGTRHVFACYADNRPWQREASDIWQAMAGDALEKFAATRNLSVIDGPKQEVDNRYNRFIETRQVVA